MFASKKQRMRIGRTLAGKDNEMKQLDARKLACPAPVLLAKETIEKEKPETMSVLVDNEAARENVSRFLRTRGYHVSAIEQGENFLVTGRREGSEESIAVKPLAPAPETKGARILVVIGSNKLGNGDDHLGGQLMINYIKTLKEMGPDLWQLIFVNSGVTLTIDDSPVLSELQEYERQGTIVLACGTCLAHFELTARKQVGESTNMLDIVMAQQHADKVITIG
jgi:selenium metabolism protein YedF